jgi:hypothetical protein
MSPIQKEKHITKDDVGALNTAYLFLMKIKYHLQSQEGKEINQELERPPSRSGGPLFSQQHPTVFLLQEQARTKTYQIPAWIIDSRRKY